MRFIIIALSAATLCGCVSGSWRDGRRPTTPAFGLAVRANINAEVAAAKTDASTTDGARAAVAGAKYQANATTQPVATASSVGASH